MQQLRLNGYHIMWLFVLFDMPTETKIHKKRAARFRKNLLKNGFTMLQYSVYVRHCPSLESSEVYIKRIKKMLEQEGKVSILTITDKQFGNMINYWGMAETDTPIKSKPQLTLF